MCHDAHCKWSMATYEVFLSVCIDETNIDIPKLFICNVEPVLPRENEYLTIYLDATPFSNSMHRRLYDDDSCIHIPSSHTHYIHVGISLYSTARSQGLSVLLQIGNAFRSTSEAFW